MDTSMLIARFIGPVSLVASLAMLVNRAYYNELMATISDNKAMLFIAGVIALVVGIAITTFHNIWAADWRVIITLFGWLSILGGVVRLVFPGAAIAMADRIAKSGTLLMVAAVFWGLFGAWLTYMGFLA